MATELAPPLWNLPARRRTLTCYPLHKPPAATTKTRRSTHVAEGGMPIPRSHGFPGVEIPSAQVVADGSAAVERVAHSPSFRMPARSDASLNHRH
jgi:hypothetical protein